MRLWTGTSLVVFGLAIAGTATPLAAAANSAVHVVRPGESIQAAIDGADAGDTVVIRQGTYWETLRISTNGITLRGHGEVTLKPPKYGYGNSNCYWPGQVAGICIAPSDFDPATSTYTNRISNVTVTSLRVVGFGDGVFGFGTENLTVSHVTAIDNAAYGVASFDGLGTTFSRNAVTGSHDAGIYVGDSPNANAVVKDNRAWGNALGILLRHVNNAIVSGNESRGNCLGIFLLADGQDGGSGHMAVFNNTVVGNDEICTQFAEAEFLPVLGGGGIVLAGSQQNAVFQNVVRDNRGDTVFSGGIVLVATTRARSDGSFDASTNNLVFLNRARGNEPADIVQDAASSGNLIIANLCRTSSPGGLCGS
jgi:nitrous oxidase accessory protein NosD